MMETIDKVPEVAGKIVGVTTFNGKIIVACEYRMYRLRDDGTFEVLRFVVEE